MFQFGRLSCRYREIGRAWFLAILSLVFLFAHFAFAQPTPTLTVTNAMTLREILQRVLDYNESVQIRILDHEISRKTYEAERGIYEPAVVGSYDHIDNRRENNAQQQRTLLTSVFAERNSIY